MPDWAALVALAMAGQRYPERVPVLIDRGGPAGSQGGCPACMPDFKQAQADLCSWHAAVRWL